MLDIEAVRKVALEAIEDNLKDIRVELDRARKLNTKIDIAFYTSQRDNAVNARRVVKYAIKYKQIRKALRQYCESHDEVDAWMFRLLYKGK